MASWRRALAHPRLPLALALLAVTLTLPALAVGWQLDDHFHRVGLAGEAGFHPLEIFSVLRGGPAVVRQYVDQGVFPWWTSEELRLTFFRYLSAASAWLDYLLWPDSAVLMHAHSLLWLGLLVAAATVLYRRVLGPGWVAGLAALLYAVDEAHAPPAAWLANRNALIATGFAVLCLIAHDRWRHEGSRRAAWAAPVWLAAALASGEAALGTLAYLAAYELCLAAGTAGRRLRALVPYAAVGGVWVAIYKALGFGASGSGLYTDPVANPGLYLAKLVERGPFLLLGQWTPLPAELGGLIPPDRRVAPWLAVVVVLALLAAAMAPLVKRSAKARFWTVGALLSLLPMVATVPSNRLLFPVGLGCAGLLAMWLEGVLAPGGWRAARLRTRLLAVALLVSHLVIAPLLVPIGAYSVKTSGTPSIAALRSLPDDRELGNQTLVVANAPDYLMYVSQVTTVALLEGRPVPRAVRGLVAGPTAVELLRVDEQTLEARLGGHLLDGPLGELFRARREAFEPGETISLPGLEIEIVDGGDPRRLRYRFAVPLEDPALRWVRFDDGRFVPFAPPPIGESVRLPAPIGPFDLFWKGSPGE